MVMKKKSKASGDWRTQMISKVRKLIKAADPNIVEEQKYKMPSKPAGVPVWYRDGMLCIGETFTHHMRINFVKGHELKDPKHLINTYRAIVLREGDKLNEAAFKDLVREAVQLNQKNKSKKSKK